MHQLVSGHVKKSEKQGKSSATWSPVLGVDWELNPHPSRKRPHGTKCTQTDPERASCTYSHILISQCETDVCRCSKINRMVINNKPQRTWFMLASIPFTSCFTSCVCVCVCVCLHVRHKNREWFWGETGSEWGRRDYIRDQKEKVWQKRKEKKKKSLHEWEKSKEKENINWKV